jgi:hypothetical protein
VFDMLQCLAYAEPPDTSDSNLQLVIVSVVVITAAAVLAFVPVFLAWSRRQRRIDVIVALAVVWGLLAAVSVIHATTAQMKWSKEKNLRIQTGYVDPKDDTDAPPLPWLQWFVLGAGYAGVVVKSFAKPKVEQPKPLL